MKKVKEGKERGRGKGRKRERGKEGNGERVKEGRRVCAYLGEKQIILLNECYFYFIHFRRRELGYSIPRSPHIQSR